MGANGSVSLPLAIITIGCPQRKDLEGDIFGVFGTRPVDLFDLAEAGRDSGGVSFDGEGFESAGVDAGVGDGGGVEEEEGRGCCQGGGCLEEEGATVGGGVVLVVCCCLVCCVDYNIYVIA